MICDRCNGSRFWLPRKSTKWKCFDCERPSTQAIVAEKNFQEDDMDHDLESAYWERVLILAGPVCDACDSRRVIEVSTPNSMVWTCWSCKAPVTVDKVPRPAKEASVRTLTKKGDLW